MSSGTRAEAVTCRGCGADAGSRRENGYDFVSSLSGEQLHDLAAELTAGAGLDLAAIAALGQRSDATA